MSAISSPILFLSHEQIAFQRGVHPNSRGGFIVAVNVVEDYQNILTFHAYTPEDLGRLEELANTMLEAVREGREAMTGGEPAVVADAAKLAAVTA